MRVASVNLLWQHRSRGLLPAGAHNAADGGGAVLVRPDEFESRTYQVFAVDAGGSVSDLYSLSVETVYRFAAAPDGRLLLGMTNDDIYIFRDGKKSRFTGDRRVTLSDLSLAPASGRFLFGWSDSLVAAHGIGLGDAPTGRLAWTREMPVPVNRVAISADAGVLAAGLQDGRILALDPTRRQLWECVQPEAITALALAAGAPLAVAGTQGGTLMALDDDGGFRWRSPVGLPVTAVAVDRGSRWSAAGLSDGAAHLLVCFGPDGSPVWEHDLEAAPTGVSMAPDGGFLLVTLATGTSMLFATDFSRAEGAAAGSRREQDLVSAREAAATGDLEGARALLLAAVAAAPHDADAAGEWLAVETRLRDQRLEQARRHAAEARLPEAVAALEAAAELDPENEDLFRERLQVRRRAVQSLSTRGAALEASGDWDAAAATWREVIALDPRCLEARRALARIRSAQARSLTEQGDERRAAGDAAGAVALWEAAVALEPGEELEARLRRAEAEACLAAGIAHYEAQRLPEAVFQLKKALALDPGSEQAARYLGYAQGRVHDSLIADRFARLE